MELGPDRDPYTGLAPVEDASLHDAVEDGRRRRAHRERDSRGSLATAVVLLACSTLLGVTWTVLAATRPEFDPAGQTGIACGPAILLISVVGGLQLYSSRMGAIRRQKSGLATDALSEAERTRVSRILDRVTIALGSTRDPRLHLIDSDRVNAAYWDEAGSSTRVDLAFTRGMLEELDDDALSAVICHLLLRPPDGDSESPELTSLQEYSRNRSRPGADVSDDDEEVVGYLARAMGDMRDADAETVKVLRHPPALLRALTATRDAGSELASDVLGDVARHRYFAWPLGGEEEEEQMRLRIEYLHRLQEVRPF